MPKKPQTDRTQQRRKRGFERTSSLLEKRVRQASEKRGFSETRLLTHWSEIVGEETASIARPIEISYARGGFGATLTVLTTGAHAPMLQMQEPKLREKVNACYGYAAIARIRITQTAPTGFAEGAPEFSPAKSRAFVRPSPEHTAAAATLADQVKDPALRKALADLGASVLERSKQNTTKPEKPE